MSLNTNKKDGRKIEYKGILDDESPDGKKSKSKSKALKKMCK